MLDTFITSVGFFTIAYTVVSFVYFCTQKRIATPTPVELATPEIEVAPVDVLEPEPVPTPAPVEVVTVTVEATAIGKPRRKVRSERQNTPLQQCTPGIRELRQQCLARGLKGAGRWSKAKCIEALAA